MELFTDIFDFSFCVARKIHRTERIICPTKNLNNNQKKMVFQMV